ncbi:hypothetical protein [Poriferisphaera corsica]|uniref:hypothetical protein n=1 Tax=Poriferisphaera corsica TaxID=2528020 RepID=UPI0011A33166|nr:hypothetical protein [Poriferisphaera corsica]
MNITEEALFFNRQEIACICRHDICRIDINMLTSERQIRQIIAFLAYQIIQKYQKHIESSKHLYISRITNLNMHLERNSRQIVADDAGKIDCFMNWIATNLEIIDQIEIRNFINEIEKQLLALLHLESCCFEYHPKIKQPKVLINYQNPDVLNNTCTGKSILNIMPSTCLWADESFKYQNSFASLTLTIDHSVQLNCSQIYLLVTITDLCSSLIQIYEEAKSKEASVQSK